MFYNPFSVDLNMLPQTFI